MAIPEDKPNPVPAWATELRGSTAQGGPAQASAAPAGTATPPPDYSMAVAAYTHRAVADAMGDLAQGKTPEAIAAKHLDMASKLMEGVG